MSPMSRVETLLSSTKSTMAPALAGSETSSSHGVHTTEMSSPTKSMILCWKRRLKSSFTACVWQRPAHGTGAPALGK